MEPSLAEMISKARECASDSVGRADKAELLLTRGLKTVHHFCSGLPS
jgi:hypothetical protein